MNKTPIPKKYRQFYKEESVDEMWQTYLIKGNVRMRKYRPMYSRLPANPRCINCHRSGG
ncbi:MAG: hypothetical protein N2D54_08730 [Chloroflexota bacterium]